MKKHISVWERFIFHSGFNPKTLKKLRPQIDHDNLLSMRIFTPLAITAFAALTVFSYFYDYLTRFMPLYVFALVGSIVSALLLQRGKHDRSRKVMAISITMMILVMLIFASLMGTVVDPHSSATVYVALLFSLPILLCLPPINIFLLIFTADALFIPLCLMYKTGDIQHNDIINVVVFSIMSLMVGVMINTHRIKRFILEYELHLAREREVERNKMLQYVCGNDTLTGMLNFFSFKSLISTFDDKHEPCNVGVMFADLNRLKHVNDTLGHDAGNAYICGFADKVKAAFSDCKCFRVSGDEFIILNFAEEEHHFLQRAEAFERKIKSDEIPTASFGYVFGTTSRLEQLTKEAEDRMYADKKAFYVRFPQFKR